MTARLIPAHAGKTCVRCAGIGGGGAHPRSRGENPHLVSVVHMDEGSSPLTRGKHAPRVRVVIPLGLIPAHAGKTSLLTARQTPRRAHPRSRGENHASVTHVS